MAKIKPRVKAPKSVAAGETFVVKTLINHTMESGQRKDKKTGEKIPRQVIHTFTATFNGELVMAAHQGGAISTNPFVEFDLAITEPGELSFKWEDEAGDVWETSKSIAIG